MCNRICCSSCCLSLVDAPLLVLFHSPYYLYLSFLFMFSTSLVNQERRIVDLDLRPAAQDLVIDLAQTFPEVVGRMLVGRLQQTEEQVRLGWDSFSLESISLAVSHSRRSRVITVLLTSLFLIRMRSPWIRSTSPSASVSSLSTTSYQRDAGSRAASSPSSIMGRSSPLPPWL